MTAARAIEILTPGAVHYSPAEYEEALALAREALQSRAGKEKCPRAISGG